MGIETAVTPTPIRVPTHSLLASVPVEDLSDDRWLGGFGWRPEPCAEGVTFNPCSAASLLDGTDDQGTALTYEPFGIAFTAECSTFTQASDPEVVGRVKRSLEAGEARLVESEFENGAVNIALGNQTLVQGAAVLSGGSAIAPIRALAELEMAAAATGGGVSYIHATRRTITFWRAAGLIEVLPSGILRTAFGTFVVGGSGYAGLSAAGSAGTGDTDWAFVTGQVQIRRSPIVVRGPFEPDVNVSNTYQTLATRSYAVTFDDCVHATIQVNHCNSTDICS